MTDLRTDPSLRFWLRYAERRGALIDRGPESSLVLLPQPLQQRLDLPEELTVTSDPDVADDGALLLGAGHPALERAARDVLDEKDVAYAIPDWPALPPPAGAELLAQARADVSLDHGRFELRAPPVAARLPVARVGALVTYQVDRPIQEREDIWLDAHSGLELAAPVRQAVATAQRSGQSADDQCLEPHLPQTLGTADRILRLRIDARLARLRREARGLREDERATVGAYYDTVLGSIAERRARADAERQGLYDAQAGAAREERERRLREIDEKHEPKSETQLFRLHLLLIPAFLLPVTVQRGARAYPFALVWLPGLRHFLPTRCPACDEPATLVAGRKSLGCSHCLASRADASLPAPPSPIPPPARDAPAAAREPSEPISQEGPPSIAPGPRGPKHEPQMAVPAQLSIDLGEPAQRTRPERPGRKSSARHRTRTGRGPEGEPDRDTDVLEALTAYRRQLAQIYRVGDSVAFDFWQRVTARRQWRHVIPRSPVATLYRLYGALGPLYAAGVPRGRLPVSATSLTEPGGMSAAAMTYGSVECDGDHFPYGLLWELVDQHAAIAEVLPGRADERPTPVPELTTGAVRETLLDPPAPSARLDAVERVLWEVEVPRRGLPIAIRCLSSWSQLGVEEAASDLPDREVAAALAYLVTRPLPMRHLRDDVASDYEVTPTALTKAQRRLERALGTV